MSQEIHGSPPNPMRSGWGEWNIADVTQDRYRSKKDMKYVTTQREAAMQFSDVPHDGEKEFLCECAVWNTMVILLLSGSSRDGKTHESYKRLTTGRMSLDQMMAPLEKVSWFTLYSHFIRLMESFGIGKKNAYSLIGLMILTKGLYRGRLPMKKHILKACPEVGDKKMSIALNVFGLYDGIGPGTDIHLFKAWRSIIVDFWGRKDADGKTVWMGRKIGSKVGRRAK